MPSIAKISIVGHVGGEPEQRYTPNGTAVSQFSVAVNAGRKQADGSYSEETDWFRVTAFGALAERVLKTVQKGAVVLVDGRFRSENWTGKDGQPRTSLTVTANDVLTFKPRDQSAEPVGRAPERDASMLEDLPF